MRHRPLRLLVLAALCSALAPLAARGQVTFPPFTILWTWPGPAPCSGTLQACIDAANPGDTVEIASNGPIDEDIQFSKSLELGAAPGYAPVFAAGRSVVAQAPFADVDRSVAIFGLTLAGGQIEARNDNNAGALRVWVTGNTILTSEYNPPITVGAQGGGPVVFTISGNTVTPKAGVSRAINVYVYDGYADGDIVGNTVTMVPDPDATGIDLYVQDGSMVVDVMRNRVSGGLHGYGIQLDQYATGTLDGRVLGNLVRNAVGGAGIRIDGSQGPNEIVLVNNTIDGNGYGILFDGAESWGSGLVANNALTNNSLIGLHNDVGVTVAAFSFRNNLFHGNGIDLGGGLGAGPGAVFAAPRYAGPADFHPAPGSPLIAAGDPAAVPPELATDLDGHPRKTGSTVDIGAYEVPEPVAGAGGLAALLALAARSRLSRSRQPG